MAMKRAQSTRGCRESQLASAYHSTEAYRVPICSVCCPKAVTPSLVSPTSSRLFANLAPLRFELQLDQNVVLDQIVGHTRIDNAEIFAVDRKFAVDFELVVRNLDVRRKADGAGFVEQGQVARHRVSGSPSAALLDRGRLKCSLRKLFDVEEVR